MPALMEICGFNVFGLSAGRFPKMEVRSTALDANFITTIADTGVTILIPEIYKNIHFSDPEGPTISALTRQASLEPGNGATA